MAVYFVQLHCETDAEVESVSGASEDNWRDFGLISRIISAYTCDFFFCSSVGSTTLVLIIPIVQVLAASPANKFPNKHDFNMNHFKVLSLGFTGNKQRKEARET